MSKIIFKLIFFTCSFVSFFSTCQTINISGIIKDGISGEEILDASIKIKDGSGARSNKYGFFSLSATKKTPIPLTISHIGYQDTTLIVNIQKDTNLVVFLFEKTTELKEVLVKSSRQLDSENTQMSQIILSASQIKKIPQLFGERDAMKALQLLPGVRQGSEGSSNIFVRGGGSDQNLILLDEGIVYNANHLFGFFSTFNADPIKQVQFYKGGFPARYGGRLSSIIDVQMKEGNNKQFKAEGGAGLISSRLTLEGPIINEKLSFMISARRTYADLLIKPILPANNKSSYYFYDINSKINYIFNSKNRLYLSFYTGTDRFSTKEIVSRGSATNTYINGVDWGNTTGIFRWNHIFNGKLFSNLSLITTKYGFELKDISERTVNEQTKKESLLYDSGILDLTVKYDFDYFLKENINLKWGAEITRHQFEPRNIEFQTNELNSESFKNFSPKLSSIEAAAYWENQIKGKNINLNAGLRLSAFKGQDILFIRPEPRLMVHYSLPKNNAINFSVAYMNQYINQLSNTGVGLPTDLWVPTNKTITPSSSMQAGIGWVKDFDKSISITIESYYKWLSDILNYKEGAEFLNISNIDKSAIFRWEDIITQGRGWSYGNELLIQKKTGRFTGNLGYTLSWAIQNAKLINNGKNFYSNTDRRHDFEITASYELKKNISINANFLYATGNALSVPRATTSVILSSELFDYGNLNSFRAEPYHRMDIGVQFTKPKKWGERIWDFSIYNLYYRKNPYYYKLEPQLDFQDKTYQYNIKRNWLLPILPSISYNFKIK